jgi:molybdopterin synthase catalytic subunit
MVICNFQTHIVKDNENSLLVFKSSENRDFLVFAGQWLVEETKSDSLLWQHEIPLSSRTVKHKNG